MTIKKVRASLIAAAFIMLGVPSFLLPIIIGVNWWHLGNSAWIAAIGAWATADVALFVIGLYWALSKWPPA